MRITESTKRRARYRQHGWCAVCGDLLNGRDEFAYHAHRHGRGGPDHEDHCVVLCRSCHERAEGDGRFHAGIHVTPSSFPYGNG